MKVNHIEYIKKVKEVNGSKIVIIGQYEGAKKPIKYRCNVCKKENEVKCASSLLKKRKHSCRNCYIESKKTSNNESARENVALKIKKNKMSKKTNSHYKSSFLKFMEKRKDIILVGEFFGKSKPTTFKCTKCSHTWNITPNKIEKNSGCYYCRKGITEAKEKYKEEVLKLHKGKITPLEEYVRAKIEIKHRCNECKKEFKASPHQIKQRLGCPYCNDANYQQRINFEQLIKKTHGKSIQVIGEYINTRTKIDFFCNFCKKVFPAFPSHVKQGSGCPECNLGVTKAKLNYKTDVENIHGNRIIVLEDYVNSVTEIKHKCNDCNKIFLSEPTNIKKGSGCPDCNISNGEKKVKSFLEKRHISYIKEWRDHDCKYSKILPMDFYLPEYNTVIEFHGKQHLEYVPFFHKNKGYFRLQKRRDRVKKTYCHHKGIHFVEIWYDKMDKIENILSKELQTAYLKKKNSIDIRTYANC